MSTPDDSPIESFRGTYFFLSNFFPHPVDFDNDTYPSVEHAYHAAKTTDVRQRKKIRLAAGAAHAKKLGKSVTLRDDWNDMRIAVMTSLLRQKFRYGTKLATQLINTVPRELIERNTWGDRFWGVCNGRGKNHLGVLLMARRTKLIQIQSEKKKQAMEADTDTDTATATRPAGSETQMLLGSAIKPNSFASGRPQILHSSMSPFGGYNNDSSQDLEFPSFPRSIGVLVRSEKLSLRAADTIVIEQEWPTLTSVIRGEESDVLTVEKMTRDKVSELAIRCRVIAEELTRHANRLDERLTGGTLVAAIKPGQAGKATSTSSAKLRYTVGRVEDRPRSHGTAMSLARTHAAKTPNASTGSQRGRKLTASADDVRRLNRALAGDDAHDGDSDD